jgi:mannose-6-phosphate isomerase-like protein (cupin superfamily)
MKAEVRKATATGEIETRERCFVLEVANDSGDEFVSIARARVEPGAATALHSLRGVAERYVIVAGIGLVEIGESDPLAVGEGDVVRIPPGTAQRITNMGSGDLVFYCVCTPPFHISCYQALE